VVVAVAGDEFEDELGDIVFVELPDVGRAVESQEAFMIVESVKAVSDIYAPAAGEITAVNETLLDRPELINESPYKDGRMIQLEISDGLDDLMDPDAYR
jgi:glycine cleavage system H protein